MAGSPKLHQMEMNVEHLWPPWPSEPDPEARPVESCIGLRLRIIAAPNLVEELYDRIGKLDWSDPDAIGKLATILGGWSCDHSELERLRAENAKLRSGRA